RAAGRGRAGRGRPRAARGNGAGRRGVAGARPRPPVELHLRRSRGALPRHGPDARPGLPGRHGRPRRPLGAVRRRAGDGPRRPDHRCDVRRRPAPGGPGEIARRIGRLRDYDHRDAAGSGAAEEAGLMTEGLLERLAHGPVLGDGGYLLELEKRGYVQAGPFTPEVSVTEPDALAELHREFLRAGAEVLQALTFYASEEKLATVGLAGRVDDINQAAVRVARSVAREGDALVAGNLSLTWAYDPADPASADPVRALFGRPADVQAGAGIG